jgi:hypothetical protein
MNLAETRSHVPIVRKAVIKSRSRKEEARLLKPIRRVSKKKAAIKREYMKLREKFLKDRPWCEYFLHFKEKRPSTEVHHKKGRGSFMLDTSTWMAVCRTAHQEIHFNPAESYRMGWMLPRR